MKLQNEITKYMYGNPYERCISAIQIFLKELDKRDNYEFSKLEIKSLKKNQISLYLVSDLYNSRYWLTYGSDGSLLAIITRNEEMISLFEYENFDDNLNLNEIKFIEELLNIWNIEAYTINKHKKDLDKKKSVLIKKTSKFFKKE